MDMSRKIGIGIVMIIPTFVCAGALWDIFHNWIVIWIWIAAVALFTSNFLLRKLSRS